MAETIRVADNCWWREAKWLKHRNKVEEAHTLLIRALNKLGETWMNTEHVLQVLDAKDPEVVVEGWLGRETARRRRLPLCRYSECTERVPAANAQYCERHAQLRARQSTRERVRRFRQGGGKGTSVTRDVTVLTSQNPRQSRTLERESRRVAMVTLGNE